jgi:hypothetical protein
MGCSKELKLITVNSVLTKDMQYVARLKISGVEESEKVEKIAKVANNIAFMTRAKIGFARITYGKQQQMETTICKLVSLDG